MRKTKIICTIGPASESEDKLKELMLAGMNVARFNFSHGSHDEHRRKFERIRKLRDELDIPVATMLDTKGPEIRLKDFKNGGRQDLRRLCKPLSTGNSTDCAWRSHRRRLY